MVSIKVKDKIQKLQKKKQEINKKIKHLKNKDALQNHHKDFKRKLLIGSYFFNKYEKEGKLSELYKILGSYLTKKRERNLFNLDNKI